MRVSDSFGILQRRIGQERAMKPARAERSWTTREILDDLVEKNVAGAIPMQLPYDMLEVADQGESWAQNLQYLCMAAYLYRHLRGQKRVPKELMTFYDRYGTTGDSESWRQEFYALLSNLPLTGFNSGEITQGSMYDLLRLYCPDLKGTFDHLQDPCPPGFTRNMSAPYDCIPNVPTQGARPPYTVPGAEPVATGAHTTRELTPGELEQAFPTPAPRPPAPMPVVTPSGGGPYKTYRIPVQERTPVPTFTPGGFVKATTQPLSYNTGQEIVGKLYAPTPMQPHLEWNENTKKAVYVCPPGMTIDPKTGNCIWERAPVPTVSPAAVQPPAFREQPSGGVQVVNPAGGTASYGGGGGAPGVPTPGGGGGGGGVSVERIPTPAGRPSIMLPGGLVSSALGPIAASGGASAASFPGLTMGRVPVVNL